MLLKDFHANYLTKSVAEFFAGIGLMRLGLEQAGWHVAFANDIDAEKRAMYLGHFKDAAPHFELGDVHKLSGEEIPTVALATASFPCNDLSLAGARAGLKGEQSSAFWGFVEAIKKMGERKPPLLLVENVVGFLTSNGGDDLYEAMRALNKLGYSVDPFIMDAVWFVPQSRQRLFVVGVLGNERNLFADSSVLRPPALMNFIHEHKDIVWNLSNIVKPPARIVRLTDILEPLADNDPQWWSRERAEYFLNQMSKRHRTIAEEMISRQRFSYATAFRRVRNGFSMAEIRVDGIAGCLRTPRGGSGRQILFKAGFGKYAVRLLTPRECARLMGADDFKISGSLNQALFGFGDAVCVPVVRWIAEKYLNPLVNFLAYECA
jgi:DNA (cytosine-5)-methyltransferase 1